nr:hypothetical protein [Acidimicrobiia bacterium]
MPYTQSVLFSEAPDVNDLGFFFLQTRKERYQRIGQRACSPRPNQYDDDGLHQVERWLLSISVRAAIARQNNSAQRSQVNRPDTVEGFSPASDTTGILHMHPLESGLGIWYRYSYPVEVNGKTISIVSSELLNLVSSDGQCAGFYRAKAESGSTSEDKISIKCIDLPSLFKSRSMTDFREKRKWDAISRRGATEFLEHTAFLQSLSDEERAELSDVERTPGLIRYTNNLGTIPSLKSIYETERFAAIALLITETARDQGIDVTLTNITNREKGSGATRPYIPPFNGALTADFSIAGEAIRLTLHMPGSQLAQFQIAPAPIAPSKSDEEGIDWTDPQLGLQSKISIGVDQGLRFFETREVSGNPYGEAYEVIT